MKLELESERLILRVLFESQADLTASFYAKNWTYLENWEPNMTVSYASPDFNRNVLRYEFEQFRQGSFIRYWYSKKETPDILTGSVCFQHITSHPFSGCEIGYKQDQAASGYGYATEAAATAISHLFSDCSMHRIFAQAEACNEPSIRLLERLGFEYEGTSRSVVFLRNGWRDCCRYALVREI